VDARKALSDGNRRLFKVMETIQATVQYNRAGLSNYDVTRGLNVTDANLGSGSLDVIMQGFEAKEIDGKVIQPLDQKCVVEAVKFNGYRPTVADWIVDDTGNRWDVLSAQLRGAGTRWVLHLRMF
jgi:cephalosporin-C deacetylase-like acetyl esterase